MHLASHQHLLIPRPMQIGALKRGEAVDKPIYNHVTGLLDPPERIEPPKVRRT